MISQDLRSKERPATPAPVHSEDSPLMEAEITLTGAHTIMRYLCDTRLPPDNQFYPRDDIKKRAVIDMMMDWHLTSLSYCGKHVQVKTIGESAFLEKNRYFFYSPDQFSKEIHKNLKVLNNEFYERKYWADLNNLTLADLLIINEVIGLNLINFDITKFPHVLESLQLSCGKFGTLREAIQPLEKVIVEKGFSLFAPSQKL